MPPLEAVPVMTAAPPAPGGGHEPPIGFSHGNRATRYACAWMAIEPVEAGDIVLSPSHPAAMFGVQACAGNAGGRP